MEKAGRYLLQGEVGRGAMGIVYRAHDPVIGRDVAVKTMHLNVSGSSLSRSELISRFQTEARAAGLLTHPNIVVVYDAGEESGVFYITMELVDGHSLQALFDSHQAFPLPRVMKLMQQACGALDYAHRHNIVHRDIKPANLMLTPDDTLKITDFGTAKILQFNATQTAHAIGTPSYMSPEQIKGKPVDGRADIFALGVILYELVTGEKPFPGENITTVIFKIINEDPISPRKLDPSIHPGLSTVILRALAKEPSARFQHCAEMLAALKNYKNHIGGLASMSDGHASRTIGGDATLALSPEERSRVRGSAITPVPGSITPPSRTTGGHTIYQANRRRSGWTVFWTTFLLLSVIGIAGYYVMPYARDVWQAIREKVSQNNTPSNPPATPGTQNSTPASIAPPAKPKTAKPAPTLPKTDQSASGVDASVNAKPPASAGTSSEPPAVNAQGDTSAQLGELKGRIEQKLADAGMANRVSLKTVGDGLVMEGRLRPNEHQALLFNLRRLPGWDRVTDDIVYDDTPGALRAGAAGAALTAVENTGISITSEPAHAFIFVNGVRQAQTTPAIISLAPGRYNIAVRHPNFNPYTERVIVKQGQTVQIMATLTRQ
jgi:serine/threonine protein kinase